MKKIMAILCVLLIFATLLSGCVLKEGGSDVGGQSTQEDSVSVRKIGQWRQDNPWVEGMRFQEMNESQRELVAKQAYLDSVQAELWDENWKEKVLGMNMTGPKVFCRLHESSEAEKLNWLERLGKLPVVIELIASLEHCDLIYMNALEQEFIYYGYLKTTLHNQDVWIKNSNFPEAVRLLDSNRTVVFVYRNGEMTSLWDACEQGIVSAEDLKTIVATTGYVRLTAPEPSTPSVIPTSAVT